jgi:hypothetical protein
MPMIDDFKGVERFAFFKRFRRYTEWVYTGSLYWGFILGVYTGSIIELLL